MTATGHIGQDWDELVQTAEEALSIDDAERGWMSAADAAVKEYGRLDHRYAFCLERLAETYWKAERFAEAEPVIVGLLNVYESMLGDEHPDVAVVLQNLAMLYHAAGKLELGEPYYERACRIRMRELGAQHPDVQNLIVNYAKLLVTLGKNSEADAVRLAMQSVASGKWNRSGHFKAIDLTDFGRNDLQDSKRMPEGEFQQGVAMAAQRPVLAPMTTSEHEVAKTWTQLMDEGDRAIEDDDFAMAERKYAASQDLLEKNGITDDRLTMTLESLAEALWKQGKFTQAEPYCEKTLKIYETVLGPKHDDVGIIANNMAMLYHANEQYEQAEQMYKRALSIRSSIVGSSHPEALSIMTNYANLLYSMRREVEGTNMKNHIRSLTSGRWSACGQFKALTAPQSKGNEDARTTGTLVYERLVETVEKHGKERKSKRKQ